MNRLILPLILLLFISASAASATEEIPATAAGLRVHGDDEDNLGLAVAAGDFNGDGYPDLFFGAPGA